MTFRHFIIGAVLCLATPVKSQDGARLFEPCAACHSVTAPDGTVLVQGGRAGPDLYGVVGRTVAGKRGFNYSSSMQEARGRGLVWSEPNFTAYMRNPNLFLQEWLGDPSARARMAFRIESGAPAIYRYLQSLER